MKHKFNIPHNMFNSGILLVLSAIILVNADGCQKRCRQSDGRKLRYTPGVVYQYRFDSESTIALSESSEEKTTMKLTGYAHLLYEGDCSYLLNLDNVEIQVEEEKLRKEMNNNFDKSIKFTMVNGELEPKICTDTNDSDFSLNIKRGIISMFQNTDNNYETDIFGICPTETTSSMQSNGLQIITKFRNLNLCSYRENFIAFMVNGIVNEKASIKSRQFLNGEYIKEQHFENGIYPKIELTEIYNMPLDNKAKSILWVKVSSNLKLIKENAEIKPTQIEKNKKSKSIIFHHASNQVVGNINALKKVLSDSVALVNDYVKPNSAQYFSELIRLMRNADFNSLMELSIGLNGITKQVYFDALVRTGTSESVRAIVKQFNTFGDKQKRIALVTLNFVHSIDLETLNQVGNLLNASSGHEAFLSIGNLVNLYCRENGCDNGELNDITQKYTSALRNCNAQTKQDEHIIVSVLKGIRNTHHVTDSITSTLIECAKPNHSARIRVATLQSYSASACNQNLQNYAMQMLLDRNEDSEIRIEAYLAVIKCPTGNIANQLAEIINSETVNQVGSFIASHLKGIRDTTDFTKEQLKRHFENIRITKKFPIDPRRYSFSNELSYEFESLGLGASAEYNVIYSQNGFLPRSMRLNLTNELFGTSYNTIDFSLRQENLENVLEHFFGPKGFLNQNPKGIFKDLMQSNQIIRSRRNVKDNTNNLSKQYSNYGGNNKCESDINLDISMKVFGSDLAFLSLGNQIPSNVDEFKKLFLTTIEEFKNGVKNFNKNYEYHSLLQDIEFAYPTGLGLTLDIAVKSHLTGKLDFGIELDVEQILSKSSSKKLRLKLIPSQDINLETYLRIDSGLLSTGLKTSANLNSNNGGDLSVQIINEKNGFNLDFKFPRKELDLVEFKFDTNFFVSEQDNILKIIPFKKGNAQSSNLIETQCFDGSKPSLGIAACLTYPKTDNMKNSLSNLVSDLFYVKLTLLTERHIHMKGEYKDNQEVKIWQLHYDTPGSKEPHKTDFEIKIGTQQPAMFARIGLKNLQVQYAFELGVKNDDREIVLYSDIQHDKANRDLSKIGFVKNDNEYRPLISISTNGKMYDEIFNYRADGTIIVQKLNNGEKYEFNNFRIVHKIYKETVINGMLEFYGLKGYATQLDIKYGNEKYLTVDSHLKINKMQNIDLGLFITEDKNLDTKIGGALVFEISEKNFEHQLFIEAGRTTIILHNKFERDSENDSDDKKIETKNHLEIKNKNDNRPLILCKLNGRFSKILIESEFELTRSDKTLSFNFKMARNQHTTDLNAKLKLNRHSTDLKAKIDLRDANYIISNELVTSWGGHATINGKISEQLSNQNAFVSLIGTFKLNNNDKDNQFTLTYADTQEKLNCNIKYKRDNVDLCIVAIDVLQLPEKQSGNIKFNIKDNLTINGKFNLKKNGGGDFNGLIHVKKIGKPIKFNGKFIYALPKFNLDATIIFDDKKIVYKTENELIKSKYNTKNNLEIGNEKLQFNASGKFQTNDNGEKITISEFLLVLPTGRKFSGNLNRQNDIKTKGTYDFILELNDIEPYGKKRAIKLTGQGKNIDYAKHLFDTKYEFGYKNFEQKDMILYINSKRLQVNDLPTYTGELSIHLVGSFLLDPIKLNLNINEYSKYNIKYGLISNIGSKFQFQSDGAYHFDSIYKLNKILKYNNKIIVNAPDTEFKTFNIEFDGHLIEKSNNNETDSTLNYHELTFNSYCRCKDQISEYKISMKGTPKQGNYDIIFKCPKSGQNYITGTWKRQLTKSDENAGQQLKTGKVEYKTRIESEKFGNSECEMHLDFIENNEINLNYKLITTNENLLLLQLQLNGRYENNPNKLITFIKLNYNNDEYKFDTKTYNEPQKIGTDIKLNTPQYGLSQIETIFETYQKDNFVKGSINIINVINFNLKSNIEVKFASTDNFNILFNANSNKLHINTIDVDIRGQNKIISVTINVSNKELLNGKIQYNNKIDKNKIVIEGRGNLLYNNEQNTASFKLVRQIFDLTTTNNELNDGELGFEYKFNGELGRKNVVSQLKVTTKNFIVKLTGCEESKQCTNFEIQSVTRIDKQQQQKLGIVPSQDLKVLSKNVEHELMILIDLRELGYPHEFELQSKSTKHGFNIKHDIDVALTSSKNKKYKLLINLRSNEKTSVQILLPKRSIVLETTTKIPDNNAMLGNYENSITFYFDKQNKPNEKVTLSFKANLSDLKTEILNANFELKFENPFIQKPLSINGEASADLNNRRAYAKIIFDIFKMDDQKIVGEVNAHASDILERKLFDYLAESRFYSKGFQLNYQAKLVTKYNHENGEYYLESLAESSGNDDLKFAVKLTSAKDKFEAQIIGFNQQLVNVKGMIDFNKLIFKAESTYQIISSKPLKLIADLSPSKSKIVLKRETLWQAISELNIGKEIHLQLTKGQNNTKIYNAKLSLDPSSFLIATQYDINKDELSNFMKLSETRLKADLQTAKTKLEDKYFKSRKTANERLTKIKENVQDMTKLLKNSKENIKSVINELEEDEYFKRLFTELRYVYEKIISILEDFTTKSTELYKKIEAAFLGFYENQNQLFNETILPALNDLNKNIFEILSEFYGEFIKIASQVFERAQKAFSNWENDLKELSKPIIEILKPFIDSFSETWKLLVKEFKEFCNDFKEYLQKLPGLFKNIYEKINNQLLKLLNSNELLQYIDNIFEVITSPIESSDFADFLDKLREYIKMKISNNKSTVNDMEELAHLYYSLIQGINSMLLHLSGDVTTTDVATTHLNIQNLILPTMQPVKFLTELLAKLPTLLTFKFSPFNYIKNEYNNIQRSFSNILSFNTQSIFNELLPPYYELKGQIADGKHIFTFDGRYITYPLTATCKYVLAQDSVNNNFTVVGNLENGILHSIVLVDRENYIEYEKNGQLKLNDEKTEFPVHTQNDEYGGTHAWRRYYTISLLSSYGVLVKCTLDLEVCNINVNGFYTSKLRGLLGNGNFEQYDDLMKPNGEISDDVLDFGNSYGLEQCPPLNYKGMQFDVNKNEQICNELFGLDSSLLFAYILIDRKPYYDACNVAVQLDRHQKRNSDISNKNACNIALTYASAARLTHYNNIPVLLPKQCVKCQYNDKQLSYNDEFITYVPKQKADIVMIIDTGVGNDILKDLIQPIINNVKQQLKNRQMTDVKLTVITYNKHLKYPNLLTTNGKINFTGKLFDSELSGPENINLFEELFSLGFEKVNNTLQQLNFIKKPIESSYKAIALALDYPFRSDAAKSILLVRADHEINEFETAIIKLGNFEYSIAPVLNFLFKSKGVSVNYISDIKDLSVEGKDKDKIVGFSKRAVAFLNGLNKRQNLEYANNQLIDTLVEDDNFVFALNNFEELKSFEHKKQFAAQVSFVLADQIYKTEVINNCKCSLRYGLHGETSCVKTSYEFVPQKKAGAVQKQG